MRYLCTIEIDVDADSPLDAARHAWGLLTSPDAFLPVIDVTGEDDSQERIDLQEEQDKALTD